MSQIRGSGGDTSGVLTLTQDKDNCWVSSEPDSFRIIPSESICSTFVIIVINAVNQVSLHIFLHLWNVYCR